VDPKTHHGFERLRLRGLFGARDKFHLAAIVQNLKTLALRLVCRRQTSRPRQSREGRASGVPVALGIEPAARPDDGENYLASSRLAPKQVAVRERPQPALLRHALDARRVPAAFSRGQD
jgi:hypothetical protein